MSRRATQRGIERKLWRDTVAQLPHGHLMPTDAPILQSYVQATLLARAAYRAIKDDPAAFRTWADATKAQVNLARSLRLTVQSREHPRTIMRGFLGTSYRPATGVSREMLDLVVNGKSPTRGWVPRGGWDE